MNTKANNRKRDSRFELLRIIAILMVVLSHFDLFGQEFRLKGDVSLSTLVGSKIFIIYGQLGVDLFVLITGYFLGKRIPTVKQSINRSWKIWGEMFFYTVCLFIIFVVCKGQFLGIKTLVVSIFPFTFSVYWFVTSYIMLILLLPFINLMINKLNRKQFVILILISVIFNDLLPLVRNYNSTNERGLGVILTAYLIGAYISIFEVKLKHKILYLTLWLFMMYLIMFAFTAFWGPSRGKGIAVSIFALVPAILIFLIASDTKPFYNSLINKLASTVFAGYLITEYPPMRTWLWKFLSFSNIQNSFVAALLGLISVMFILFVIVFIIDSIRQKIFKVCHVDEFPDYIYNKIFD